MPGDFDRLSFDSAKHYISVLLQQGRVGIPSDHNESVEILLRLLQNSNLDRVGCSGSPNYGFKIGELIPVDGMESLKGWSTSHGADNNMVVTMEHFHMFEGKSSIKVINKSSIKVINNTGTKPSLTKTFDKVMDFSDSKNLYIAVSNMGDSLGNFTIQLIDNLSNSVAITSPENPRIGREIPPNRRWDLYKFSLFESALNVDFDMTSVKCVAIEIPDKAELCLDFLSRDYLHPVITWDSNTRHPFWNGSIQNPGSLDIDYEDGLFFGSPSLLCNDTSGDFNTVQWDYDKPKNFMSSNNSYIISSVEIAISKDVGNGQTLSPIFINEDGSEIVLEESKSEIFGTGDNVWTLHSFSIPANSLLRQVKSLRINNLPSQCNIGPVRAVPNLEHDFIVVGDVGFDTSNTTCSCECNGQEMAKTTGKYYCHGKMCLKEHHGTYMTQADYPFPTPLSLAPNDDENNKLFMLLDCWEEIFSHIQDPSIKEVALGGPDTAVRLKQMCPIRYIETADYVKTLINCTATGKGRLSTMTEEPTDPIDPCSIEPISGYSGNNWFFKVEINKGGPLGEATFKWSKDSGSIESRIVSFDGKSSSGSGINSEDGTGTMNISVESLGRDKNTMFKIGNYIEITDDSHEWNDYTNKRGPDKKHLHVGEIRQIADINLDTNTISWFLGLPDDDEESLSELHSELKGIYRTSLNAKVRKWDGYGKVASDPNARDAGGNKFVNPQLRLGNGILLSFTDRDGEFRTRDFWTFKGREIPRHIDHLTDSLPMGPIHNYCPLALIDKKSTNGAIKEEFVNDLRLKFPPSTDITGSDVYIDNTKCGMEGVQTVQQAIDRLCSERSGTICSVTVREKTGDAIQHAISSLGEEGGVVCIPKGVYEVRSPIKISNGITLKGEGIATRIISGNDNQMPTPEIFVIGSSFVHMKDVFIGFGNNQTAVSIRSDNRNSSIPSNIAIEDCIFVQKGLDNENEDEIDNENENKISAIHIVGSALGLQIKNNFIVSNKAVSLSSSIDRGGIYNVSGLELSHNTVFCKSNALLCVIQQGSLSTWKINNNWISGIGSLTTNALDLTNLDGFIQLANNLMPFTMSKYFSGGEKANQIACKGIGILIHGLADHFEIQDNTIFSSSSCIAIMGSASDHSRQESCNNCFIYRNFMYSSASGEDGHVLELQGKIKNSSISHNHILSYSIFQDASTKGACIKLNDVMIEDISIMNNVFGGNIGLEIGDSIGVINYMNLSHNSFFCKSSAINITVKQQIGLSKSIDVYKNVIVGCLFEPAVVLSGLKYAGIKITDNWLLVLESAIVIAHLGTDQPEKSVESSYIKGNLINLINLQHDSNNHAIYGIEVLQHDICLEDNTIDVLKRTELETKIEIPVPDFDGSFLDISPEIRDVVNASSNMVGGILVGKKLDAILVINFLDKILKRMLKEIYLLPIQRMVPVENSDRDIPLKFDKIPAGIYSLYLVMSDGKVMTDKFIVEPSTIIEIQLSLIRTELHTESKRIIFMSMIPYKGSINSLPLYNILIRNNTIKNGSGNGITLVSNVDCLIVSGNNVMGHSLSAVAASALDIITNYLSIINNQIINCCRYNIGRILYGDISRWNTAIALGEGTSMNISNNRIIIKQQTDIRLRSHNVKFFIKGGIMLIDSSISSINHNHILFGSLGKDEDESEESGYNDIPFRDDTTLIEVGIELLDTNSLQIQGNIIETNGIALLKYTETGIERDKRINKELALAIFETYIGIRSTGPDIRGTTFTRDYMVEKSEREREYYLKESSSATNPSIIKTFESSELSSGNISITNNYFYNNYFRNKRSLYTILDFIIVKGTDKIVFNDNICTDLRFITNILSRPIVVIPDKHNQHIFISGKKVIMSNNNISTTIYKNNNQIWSIRSSGDYGICTGNISSDKIHLEFVKVVEANNLTEEP